MGWHRPGPPHIVGRYRHRIGSIAFRWERFSRADIGWVLAPEVVRADGTYGQPRQIHDVGGIPDSALSEAAFALSPPRPGTALMR